MRVCGSCGGSLEGRRRNVKFCNSACRQRAHKLRHGAHTPERYWNQRDAQDMFRLGPMPALPGAWREGDLLRDHGQARFRPRQRPHQSHESRPPTLPQSDRFWRAVRYGADLVEQPTFDERGRHDRYNDPRVPVGWGACVQKWIARYTEYRRARTLLRLERERLAADLDELREHGLADIAQMSTAEQIDALLQLVRSDRLPMDRGHVLVARTASASPGAGITLAPEISESDAQIRDLNEEHTDG